MHEYSLLLKGIVIFLLVWERLQGTDKSNEPWYKRLVACPISAFKRFGTLMFTPNSE